MTKKEFHWKAALIPLLLAAILATLLFTYSNSTITGDVIDLNIPSDCSESGINALWDTIFQESSSGTTILTEITGETCRFYSHKVKADNETFYLTSTGGITAAVRLLPSQNFLKDLTNITEILEIDVTSLILDRDTDIEISQINSTFEAIYKITTTPSWNQGEFSGYPEETLFTSIEQEEDASKTLTGMITLNKSHESLTYIELDIACTPLWQAIETSCSEDETGTAWYNDTNSCGETKANATINCDYNKNGIIGNSESPDVTEVTLKINIDNAELNNSKNYTGTKPITFIDVNKTIIEFNWDFSNPLDLSLIDIEKQPANAEAGYIIINDLNTNKTIYLDAISGSNQICIKDQANVIRSDVSLNCTAANESLLNCPGTNGTYSCNVDGNQLKVTGLMHSAVVELEGTPQTCIPDWSCEWSGICSENVESGLCVDNNFCDTLEGKPNETRECESCEPTWICTAWTPETCFAGDEQTRTCSDQNSCGTTTNKPSETRECVNPESTFNIKAILIIILGLLAIGAIIAVIIHFINKKAEEPTTTPTQPSTKPPVTPQQKPIMKKPTPRLIPVKPVTKPIVQKPAVKKAPITPVKPKPSTPRKNIFNK